ncbi:MAG: 3-oxoacyl-ACP reductase FabG [Ruminococcus sp.]|nr:3-oxoacyl-ACP reductase FabG [Ruminococcus sp.]
MNKVALVTGGSGGIGSAICRKLAGDGYFVYVNYCRNAEKAEAIAAEIGGKAVGFDVADRGAAEEAIAAIGDIDLLVNNSGVSVIGLFDSIDQSTADRLLMTDLAGTMNCSRCAVKSMIRNKSGNIINIASMWGEVGASCEVDYSAAKAGVIGFTKALAKEVAPSGIRVNCVSPGFILTEMNSHFSDDDLALIKEDIPLGIFGKPEHIADAVAFLASDSAEYITGQILGVNGGMVI